MRIISWNVNGIRAIAKKGFLEFCSKYDPDILCLQETKVHPDQLEEQLLNMLGRQSFWSAAQRPGYSGTATYLKTAAAGVKYGIGIKKFDTEGRFVVTDHTDFVLYNVYFPNGGSGEERHLFKQDFLRKFKSHLQSTKDEGREIIVVGDYNVAHKPIDIFDPIKLAGESGFLPEEREWFDEFLSVGFVDLFRHFHPDAAQRYSWWSYQERGRIGNRGWRIDYICATEGLLKKIKSCDLLDDVQGSDHCPVICDFK
jgi:exodeoxyribonuclease III